MDMVFASLAFIDGLGAPEMLLIFVIVLVLFGGQKLPEFARGLGKTMREFKKAAAGVEEEFKRALDEDERKHAVPHLTAPVTPPAGTTPTSVDGAGPEVSSYHPDEYHHDDYHNEHHTEHQDVAAETPADLTKENAASGTTPAPAAATSEASTAAPPPAAAQTPPTTPPASPSAAAPSPAPAAPPPAPAVNPPPPAAPGHPEKP